MTASKTSTKSLFISAFAALPANTTRKTALALLSEQFGISEACASTYYSNCKAGRWTLTINTELNTAVVTPIVEAVAGVTEIVSDEPTVTTIEGVTITETKNTTTVDGVSLDTMTGPELVAYYNALPDVTPVTKFRTKADGVKRIVDHIAR